MPTPRLAGTSPRKRILAPAPVKAAQTVQRSLGDRGIPTREECDVVINDYLQSLSIRKREKALVTQDMFDDIWDLLQQPALKIRTPQFRFWVRKMFKLSCAPRSSADVPDAADDSDLVSIILHEDRPVAVKEQVYDILCYYHLASGHGGRDKTMAAIRDNYSWVPKELVSRFVKACPTCYSKRPGYVTGTTYLESLATRKLSLDDRAMMRTSSSDYDSDALSSSYSQAASLASSEEGFMVNPPLDPALGPGYIPNPTYTAVPTIASLLESRILPPPVVSPILRSPPLGSPNLSADPRKWLSDLMMQPGPNCVGSSHKFPPLALRRVGSEGEGEPVHPRMPLPPLMKALSESMADESMLRPGFNVPTDLQIPRRDSLMGAYNTDIVMSESTSGLQYPPSDSEDHANIDPVLLSQPVVKTYEDYYRQQREGGRRVYTQSVDPRLTTFLPMHFDYRAPPVQRSASEDSMSSAGSVGSLGSAPPEEHGYHGGQSSLSEMSTKGMQESSSLGEQDWESSYCLDEL